MNTLEFWKDKEPIGEQVVLEFVKNESSIIIPENGKPTERLRVLATGPGRIVGDKRIPTQCKPGDIVLVDGAIGCFKLRMQDEKSYGIIPEHRISIIIDKSGREESN